MIGAVVADYDIPEHLRYSEEDEWTQLEGNRVTTGIQGLGGVNTYSSGAVHGGDGLFVPLQNL